MRFSVGVKANATADEESVFYNRVQVVNRDLSIVVIQTFIDKLVPLRKVQKRRAGRGIRILEALSASGLRSIRYHHEMTGVEYIIANDLDPGSVKTIRDNLNLNGIPHTKVIPNCDDAVELMHRLSRDQSSAKLFRQEPDGTFCPLLQQEQMDVVDLDPYGSASPFLEAAVVCVEEGGLLCVTCTDSAVLCGKYPETCHAKYGSFSLNTDHCHEMAVRILLCCLERTANRHRRYIKPLLSLSIDFYIRVFVQVFTQPVEVKLSAARMSYVLQCTRCRTFLLQPVAVAKEHKKRSRDEATCEDGSREGLFFPGPCSPPLPDRTKTPNFTVNPGTSSYALHDKCPSCASPMWLAGPVYNQPIHNPSFVESCLQTVAQSPSTARKLGASDRVNALLNGALEELSDVPLYYSLPQICSNLRLTCPPLLEVTSALGRLGYRCSQVHASADGLKTDAPANVLYGVMRTRAEKNWLSTNPGQPFEGSFVDVPAVACDFTPDAQYDIRTKRQGVKKFLPNPEPQWGPKAKHKSTSGI